MYDGSDLVPLQSSHFERILAAKSVAWILGGDYVHKRLPEVFPQESSIHLDCYKNYTKAISISRKRGVSDSA